MLKTTRTPATVGETLTKEFMELMSLTQGGARRSDGCHA